MVPDEGALEVMLLRQHSVREELKLSHNEAHKIHSFAKKQYEKAKEISKLPEAERDRRFEELAMENHRFIDQTISKEQRKRLQEIELQVGGLMCMSRSTIAQKLNLSEDQKKKLRQMQEEARREMDQLISSDKSEKEKLREIHASTQRKMRDLLNDDQEKTWEQMMGAPFKGELKLES